jgi:hypothetical protein
LFGGWDNKTRFAGEKTTEAPALKINAFAAFAGIEVHN